MGLKKTAACIENIFVCEYRTATFVADTYHGNIPKFRCELLDCDCKDATTPKIKLSEG
jgi:hypothetical protein